jgi:chemosensory pili system protein ChpA (sensor histidine kinase/response regulator)
MPLQPVEAAPAPAQEARAPTVMVVDDSITMRKVTSRVLENHSLEVVTANDGIDASEKLRDVVPDLILLDIEMPRMDGYELLEHIRADARLRHVPVVMITSRAGQKHRKKARAAGANDYLTKPYQEPELVEKVGEMLDRELTPRRSD